MVITTKKGLKRLVLWKFPGAKPVKIIKPLHPDLASFVENMESMSNSIWQKNKAEHKEKAKRREQLLFLDRVYDAVIDSLLKVKIQEMEKAQKEKAKNEREEKRKHRKESGGSGRIPGNESGVIESSGVLPEHEEPRASSDQSTQARSQPGPIAGE